MPGPHVRDFVIDEENDEKFAAHGLTAWRVLQILEDEHVIVRNRKHRRAMYLLIGRDRGRACIAVPIERTHQANV